MNRKLVSIFSIFLTLFIVLGFAACESKEEKKNEKKEEEKKEEEKKEEKKEEEKKKEGAYINVNNTLYEIKL